MKKSFCLFRMALFALLTSLFFSVHAQDSSSFQVISPYDSLVLSDIKATGNLETGTLEISMQFRTDYHKLTDVYFSLGHFEELGITDDMGKKYKVYTNTYLIGTDKINQGYLQVTGVQFGNNTMNWLTYLKDTLQTGQSKKLVIRLGKVNKAIRTIRDFHIRCVLSLNYMWVGDKVYQVKNIRVDWVKPKAKVVPRKAH